MYGKIIPRQNAFRWISFVALLLPWIRPLSSNPVGTRPHNKIGDPGGCFTNVSRTLQNNLAKIYNVRNHIDGENFKVKLCTCAQSMALCTRTKFQLEMLIRSVISATHTFRENILESSQNVSETTPQGHS